VCSPVTVGHHNLRPRDGGRVPQARAGPAGFSPRGWRPANERGFKNGPGCVTYRVAGPSRAPSRNRYQAEDRRSMPEADVRLHHVNSAATENVTLQVDQHVSVMRHFEVRQSVAPTDLVGRSWGQQRAPGFDDQSLSGRVRGPCFCIPPFRMSRPGQPPNLTLRCLYLHWVAVALAVAKPPCKPLSTPVGRDRHG
jgi:hypothetical protein